MEEDLAAIIQRARDLHRTGQPEQARPLYEQVLRRQPDHPDALHLLGLCEHSAGRREAAIGLIERAIAGNARDATYLNSLALVLHELERLDDAGAAYERAIALDGSVPDYHNNLAIVRIQQGRYDEAEVAARRALALRPNFASALNNLGLVFMRRGKLDEAEAAYARAALLLPRNARPWVNLALVRHRRRDLPGAAYAYQCAIEREPNEPKHLLALGEVLTELERLDEAADVLRRALRLRPGLEDAQFLLAALGGAPIPPGAPHGYVRRLFDGYAHRFDHHLRETLGYRAPEALVDAVRRAGLPQRPLDVLDAGCGTGLCGPLLRPLARRLVGVDLSPNMIDRATRSGAYDEMVVADLVAFMRERPAQFDLIVAADVLIYVGQLEEPLGAVAAALRPGGVFAATVETHDGGDGVVLGASRRYAHAPSYVRTTAASSGLSVEVEEPSAIRRQSGQDVDGLIVVLRPLINDELSST